MMYYEYKSRSRVDGKTKSGVITAESYDNATDTLKRRGEDIIVLSEMRDFLGIRKTLYSISLNTTKKLKLEFFTMLRFMFEAGVSLHETLTNIRDTSTNKSVKMLASTLADEVRKGASLSTAMKKSGQFDGESVEQVRAGEESGNINATIIRLIKQYEREIEFKGKIKSAMIYPVIICVVMIAVLWVMMAIVVPTLAETLISMGGELPLITKIVIGVSKFISKSTPYIVVLIILAVISLKILKKNDDIKLAVDRRKLKLPVIGTMLEKIELARFCRSLSAMQKSGISLVASLKTVASAVKNMKIKNAVMKAARLVEISGINLAAALSKAGQFPPMLIQLIEIGVNSGKITDVLDRTAEQYERDIDVNLKRITSLIEPAMIIIVGLLAGTVVISIFLPMFSIVDSMGV